ncbi:MAG: deoxyguanosinetriphosphate triphosphohydrolase family protein [Gemmatimonadales bacterium]|nr:deoxyguanosinetriphosphate triphosphohydrolase family protein [Gemmatimonadales bacterium]
MDAWIERKRYADDGKHRKRFNSLTADSDFQRDRARVIHSAAFRRLQTKTQVLGVGENDFYRTRLTHSLEVAQIGFGISEHFREVYKSTPEFVEWIPTQCAIEVVGLCHDIGHPPYGHGGEVALNYSMREFGGFEGNGQTLRIVSKLGEFSPRHGLDLTRRTMLGLLKYPALYSSLVHQSETPMHNSSTNLDSWKPPKCVLDEESEVLEWILDPFEATDIALLMEFKKEEGKHGKTKFKPFDTTIMDVADDISYGVHDFEDAIVLQLIDKEDWDREIDPILRQNPDCPICQTKDTYRERLFSGSNRKRKHAISKLVSYFMNEVELVQNQDFSHPLLRFQAIMAEPAASILNGLMELVRQKVISIPEVQTLEYKGQQLIVRLFEVLLENPNRLLPATTYERFKDSNRPERVICDYLAGMTDSYATKVYHKIFSPSVGSVFDRL